MKRGTPPAAPRSMADCWSDWYYWSHNAFIHYLVFREQEDRVVTVAIRPQNGVYDFVVYGPCWSTFEARGSATTLESAKEQCQRHVNQIICEEFRQEYLPVLG